MSIKQCSIVGNTGNRAGAFAPIVIVRGLHEQLVSLIRDRSRTWFRAHATEVLVPPDNCSQKHLLYKKKFVRLHASLRALIIAFIDPEVFISFGLCRRGSVRLEFDWLAGPDNVLFMRKALKTIKEIPGLISAPGAECNNIAKMTTLA